MSVLLAQALRWREWSGVLVLSPHRGPGDVDLRGVRVMSDPTDVPEDATGYLLVVAAPVDRDDWRTDVLLRRAVGAGAAALMLPGHEPLGRASAHVAGRLSLVVVGAPDPLAASVALGVQLALPEHTGARLVAATVDAARRAPTGVEDFLGVLSRLWRREVWLVDASGAVVAGPGPAPAEDEAGVRRPVPTDHPRAAFAVLRRLDGDDEDQLGGPLEVVGEVLGGRLATQRLAAERDARHRTSMLAELMRSDGHVGSESPRRVLDLGWRLDGWHIAVRVDVPRAVDPVALRPDVQRAFEEAGLDTVVVEHGPGWAVWTRFEAAPSQAEVQQHSSSVRRAQWRLRSRMPSVMGVGRALTGPEGLVQSLREAGDAARIAATRPASGHLAHVDRMGLSQLLLAWTRTETFAPAAEALLAPLRDQPDLLETLATYLDCESSTAETAAVLGVHRNTVAARLGRLSRLLGVDLADSDERLAVQLACRSLLSAR